MDPIRLAAVAALPLLLATGAAAEPLRSVRATPWSASEVPERPFANPVVIRPPGLPMITAPNESIAYRDDRLHQPGFYFSPGADSLFADDLHMLFPGRLTNFTIGIYKIPKTPVTSATFYFYANDPNDSGVGALLAGPYVIGTLLPEYRAYEVIAADSAQVNQHVWLAVKFSTGFASLVLGEEAVVGVSHDVYWDFENGGASQLPVPPANFLFEVRLIPDLVPVEPVTWTHIKALYAPAIRSAPGYREP
jgi:hypothetical protein